MLSRAWSACLIVVLVFGGVASASVAQTGRIEGRVVEAETDEPLPGANVILRDTGRGTATQSDGAVVSRVGQAAMSAGDREYVPDAEAVLAATGLADPGETVTVTFEAPSEPGEYTYVCTFPGHWSTMQGTMRVVES